MTREKDKPSEGLLISSSRALITLALNFPRRGPATGLGGGLRKSRKSVAGQTGGHLPPTMV